MSRVAIITGAGKRVGRHLAAGLAADGWTVVAHVRDDPSQAPPGTIGVAADLSAPDAAARIFAACPNAPALLVNNAAVFHADELDDFTYVDMEQHFRVNVAAPAALSAAFARAVGQGDRCIINILDAKLSALNPDFLSYTLSKAALACLTKVSARAFSPKSIRVNAIAPALMLLSEGQTAENFAATHDLNPLKHGVSAEDVLHAIRHLVDAPAVTGQTLILDGGQRFWNFPRDVQFIKPGQT